MYFEKDWLLRQIRVTAQMLARLAFNKDTPFYEMENREAQSASDLVHEKIMRLLDEGRFNEAEDMLFDALEEHGISCLRVATDFYARLNEFDDTVLEQNGFEREEIAQGLEDVKAMFGLFF
ncbi:MAG: DUF6483 family protein [Clostridiaceae bacterium]|nr:DUF6483 family protein [Eubacteriales bacterium]